MSADTTLCSGTKALIPLATGLATPIQLRAILTGTLFRSESEYFSFRLGTQLLVFSSELAPQLPRLLSLISTTQGRLLASNFVELTPKSI